MRPGVDQASAEMHAAFVARYGTRRGTTLWREWAAYEDAGHAAVARSAYQSCVKHAKGERVAECRALAQ